MRGTYRQNDPDDARRGGWYTDARGIEWKVTYEAVGGGLVKKSQWTAQSAADDDNGRYFTETGWTARTFDQLLADVDEYAASRSRGAGGVAVLVAIVAAIWYLDKRGR